jgi:hypothetical protein
MCQMYLFTYMCYKTENLRNLGGINLNVLLNVISPNLR